MNVANTSSVSLWFWVIGAILLGIFVAHGLWKTGRLSPRERQRLDQNTIETQREEDPLKRHSLRAAVSDGTAAARRRDRERAE